LGARNPRVPTRAVRKKKKFEVVGQKDSPVKSRVGEAVSNALKGARWGMGSGEFAGRV